MKSRGDAIADRRTAPQSKRTARVSQGATKPPKTAMLNGRGAHTATKLPKTAMLNGRGAHTATKLPKTDELNGRGAHTATKLPKTDELNGRGAHTATKLPKTDKLNGRGAHTASQTPKTAMLRKRYAKLCEDYLLLARELRSNDRYGGAAEDWLVEGAPFGLAWFENGHLAVGNTRFQNRMRHRAGELWRLCDTAVPARKMPSASLSQLVTRAVKAATREGSGLSTAVYRRNGVDEYVEASIWRLPDPGAANQAMVLLRDATDQGRAMVERDLLLAALTQHERLRAIGELASGVTHDLNNTFHAINLRLSFIQSSAACIAEQGENIAALSRIINDASVVVGRLQDFARQQHERTLEAVNLVSVVEEAIEMVRTTIEGQTSLSGVPVRIHTDLPALPRVSVQASDLRHVMVNLLLNARDAMPGGGNIEVVGREHEGRVIVEVLDEGCGIPDSDLEKIFCPFFTTKGSRGTGLGLSNARRVLSLLGSDIRAHNRPTGGACFTLSFGAAPPTEPRIEPPRASNPPPGRRILVVDDHADNREATKMVLECQGQTVDVAGSGADALDRLRAGARYDLVFCDLGMPDMNGWRVAREIQKVAPGTIVYLLTGWAQQVATDDPRRRWVKGVLEKPMDPELMRELLSRELEVVPGTIPTVISP